MSGFKVKLVDKSSWLRDAGHTIQEESDIYDKLLEDIYNNPRWYIDNLSYLCEFRLSWANYRENRGIMPYKFTRKPKGL